MQHMMVTLNNTLGFCKGMNIMSFVITYMQLMIYYCNQRISFWLCVYGQFDFSGNFFAKLQIAYVIKYLFYFLVLNIMIENMMQLDYFNCLLHNYTLSIYVNIHKQSLLTIILCCIGLFMNTSYCFITVLVSCCSYCYYCFFCTFGCLLCTQICFQIWFEM